jgi:hypothetical protein
MKKVVKTVVVDAKMDSGIVNHCASLALDPDNTGIMPCGRYGEPCDGCNWYMPDRYHIGDTLTLNDTDGVMSVELEKAVKA